MSPALVRRLLAEALGTCLLVCAVIGSGIAAARLSPGDVGLQLLENSLATGGVLVATILALHPVSASFNPVVTLAEVVLDRLRPLEAAGLIAAQVVGGAVGAMLANVMFDLDVVSVATQHRASGGHLVGEAVATFGLVLVVFGTLRGRRPETVAFAVAGYIVAAYWFTSSTSFANPAVTLARTLSDTFAGIAPASVAAFVVLQLVGGAIAVGAVRVLHPRPASEPAPEPASSSEGVRA